MHASTRVTCRMAAWVCLEVAPDGRIGITAQDLLQSINLSVFSSTDILSAFRGRDGLEQLQVPTVAYRCFGHDSCPTRNDS